MKSGQEISVAYLETIRQRRMRRIRRQRAIEVGKPVDVPLKPVALNPVQKKLLNPLVLMLRRQSVTQSPTTQSAISEYATFQPRQFSRTPNPLPFGFGPTPPNPSGNYVPTPGHERIPRDALKPTEILTPPGFRNKVEPKYPSEAKRAGKEGKVVLEATIDVDGKAKDVVIKEDTVGFGCARAAIVALEASLFTPAERGGDEIVRIRIAIPYQFKLKIKQFHGKVN